jgi:hypothetical protein
LDPSDSGEKSLCKKVKFEVEIVSGKGFADFGEQFNKQKMESGINPKITLIIDYREQRSGIISEIEKISNQINCEIMRLPIGDYQVDDKIIIERKTIADFLLKTVGFFNRHTGWQTYRVLPF